VACDKVAVARRLAERGYLHVSVHRGKNLLVADEIAAILDPICRAKIERMHGGDSSCARLLDYLAEAGPSNIEHQQLELGVIHPGSVGGSVRWRPPLGCCLS
jgi:hypothetical protein